jgi:tetratricopeptide (TPR) repeat protein
MVHKVRLVLLMTFGVATLLAAPGFAGQDKPAVDPLQLVTEGRKLVTGNKLDEAMAKYQQALAIDPKLFEAHVSLGIVLDLKGQYAEARTHLDRGLAEAQASADDADTALNALGVASVFARDVPGAARAYQQLFDRRSAASRPDAAAEAANALGRVYLETGDAKNARRWYETAHATVQKMPGQTADQIDLWEMRWHHALSRLAARAGDKKTAAREADAVKALIDKGGLNASQAPIYEYLVGYNAFYAKSYDAAIAALQRADQKDPFILGLIAQSYEKKKDAASAQAWWTKVLALPAHSIQNGIMRPLAVKATTASPASK